MEFDTSLSLELVVTILAILVAVWRMEGRFDRQIAALRRELKGDIADVRTDLKSFYTELKADNAALRQEFKGDIAELRTELKGDIAELRTDLRRVEGKVDDCNQRVARVEGIILAREDMVDTIADSPQ